MADINEVVVRGSAPPRGACFLRNDQQLMLDTGSKRPRRIGL
jgi:hypothetical protein